MKQPQNVIFWGAGATARLGIRTTASQARFIQDLAGARPDSKKPLAERVGAALGAKTADKWHSALIDLLTILGDGDDDLGNVDVIEDSQRAAMRRNWSDAEVDSRIRQLRLIYDWPALRALVRICPGSFAESFNINDLFNLLDLHIPLGFGVRVPVQSKSGADPAVEFLDARRLIGAKNALRMVLIASFYIDWQECIRLNSKTLDAYYDFAIQLGQRMQRRGIALAVAHPLDEPEFYQGDVGFVSLNYDPILLWSQFMANRHLNKSPSVPHIGVPAVPLHIFQDFGNLIPARRIARPKSDWPWYPMNEAATQRLNEESETGPRVRLTKFLFPHGSLCWRECPDCRKLSAFHGDEWKLDVGGVFPPPPLKAFEVCGLPYWLGKDERGQREKGAIDARACLHCGTLTYAHHTQTVMQSSFKVPPPSFIEEIQRDLRATTMHARHIIFMGYSLPPDDVGYRALFAATCQRGADTSGSEPVRCTVINWDKDNPGWYGPSELKRLRPSFSKEHVVNAAADVFHEENVRFYGGGIPDVFLDGGTVTEAKVEQLLDWSSTSA